MNERDRTIRFLAIKDIGCIVCLNRGLGVVPCEIHHLLSTGMHGNGKRKGDAWTVGLCQYHHRGVGTPTAALGPSYAREPRKFRELYSDEWLLSYQGRLIGAWQASLVGRKVA